MARFRHDNRARFPAFFNAPVPSFGSLSARVLIVGLAPGLKGANCTGRPFTGDYAGDVLYRVLGRHGLADGDYDRRRDDGLRLVSCRITNAVRCVPPENKPATAEIAACSRFLQAEVAALADLKAILALGRIAHAAVLRALDCRPGRFAFAHGAVRRLPAGLLLADSYHCSRYNINTGRITEEMLSEVVAAMLAAIAGKDSSASRA